MEISWRTDQKQAAEPIAQRCVDQGSPNKGPQGHLKSELFSQAHNLSITVTGNQLRTGRQ